MTAHASSPPAERSWKFDHLLLDLSSHFASLAAPEFEAGIPDGLSRIRRFLGAHRGSLFEFSADRETLHAIHFSAGAGVPPPTAVESANESSWLATKLDGRARTVVTRIEELPEAAVGEREYFRANGITSSVIVPLTAGGVVLGALGFSTTGAVAGPDAWTIRRLPLVADIFSLALARARSEIVVRRQRDDLARVARLSTVGELTFTLAHELSQPLTAIMSNAQAAQRLLRASQPDLDEVREALADIVDANRRAGAVIARLRSLLGPGAATTSRLDVNGVVREVVTLLEADAREARISVTLDLADGLPPVEGDRVGLQQVLLNLVMNSFDALRRQNDGRRELVVRTLEGSSGTVSVSLTDTGGGLVGDADVEGLFEPFFSTKPDGLGVGLMVCRSIIDGHGGRLWAARNPGRGLTFHFTLPVDKSL